MRVGKSLLVHLLTGKNVEVKAQNNSCTQQAEAFEGNLDNHPFLCIDTAGLMDKSDDKKIKDLKQYLSKDVKVKKIFIVINFQSQDFNIGLIDCFVKIASIFPMEDFWNRVVICYSHYFDQRFKTKEQQKELLEESNKEEFNKVIQKLNEIHNIKIVSYNDISKIYYDIYSDEDINQATQQEKESIKRNNKEYKRLFDSEIRKIFKDIAMYNSLVSEIIKNMEFGIVQKNNPNKIEIKQCDAIRTRYYDFNNKLIQETLIPCENLDKLDVIKIKNINFFDNLGTGGFFSTIGGGGVAALTSIVLMFIPGGQPLALILGGCSLSGLATITGGALIVTEYIKNDNYKSGINSAISNYKKCQK